MMTAPTTRMIRSIVSQEGMLFAGFGMAVTLHYPYSPAGRLDT
jgi:hypothetical protein